MTSSRRLIVLFAAVLLALALVAGCAKQATKDPGSLRPEDKVPARLSGEPVVIGAMFAITGDASSLGIPERNTAQMLEGMINESGGINGRPLKLVIEDTKGENT